MLKAILAALGVLGILFHLISKRVGRLPAGSHFAPGPWNLPFKLGNLQLGLERHQRMHFFLRQVRKFGGTFCIDIPLMTMIVITDPPNVEHVLKTNFDNYPKGPYFRSRFESLLGGGIFNADGAQWKVQRKVASHLFSTRMLRDFMTEIFLQHSHLVIDRLDAIASSGELFDMQDVYYRYTLDSIGHIAFGVNINSLGRENVEFSRAFDRAQAISTERFFSAVWKLWRVIGMPWERQLAQDIETLNSFAMEVINARRNEENLESRKDVLSRFMCMTDADGKPFTDEYLRDILMNFLIAGRDTTAQALSWATYNLARKPHVAERLIDEVNRVIGDRDPTFEDLGNLEYTSAVVNETLRLHPSVPMDQKSCMNDDVLPDGTFVPKGAQVVYGPWLMGRRPELWGEDCEEFKPERWIGMETPSPFKFSAFQAGPRTCLGIQMAPLEIKMMLAMAMPRYEFELEPNQEVTYSLTATLPIRDGLWMRAKRR